MLAIAAKVLWEVPLQNGVASLDLRCQIKDLPAGSRMQVWAGPKDQWPNIPWHQIETPVQADPASGKVRMPLMILPVALRRWIHDYIPRGTADLIVIRIEAKPEKPRYCVIPLGMDWRSGSLRPGRRMFMSVSSPWEGMDTDLAEAVRRQQ